MCDRGGGLKIRLKGLEEGVGQKVRANLCWMCEKDRYQLIGKTDCRTEREGIEGSVRVCCGGLWM